MGLIVANWKQQINMHNIWLTQCDGIQCPVEWKTIELGVSISLPLALVNQKFERTDLPFNLSIAIAAKIIKPQRNYKITMTLII